MLFAKKCSQIMWLMRLWGVCFFMADLEYFTSSLECSIALDRGEGDLEQVIFAVLCIDE